MKKFIMFIALFVVIAMPAIAQIVNQLEHKVVREETINSIAESYGVDVEKLIEVNDNLFDYDPDEPLLEEGSYEEIIILIPLPNVYHQFWLDFNVYGNTLDYSAKNWPGYYGRIQTLVQLPWAVDFALNDNLHLWPVIYGHYYFNDLRKSGDATLQQQGMSWQVGAGAKLQSVNYYLSAIAKYGQVDNKMTIASGFSNRYFYHSIGGEVEARIYKKRNKNQNFFTDLGGKVDGMFVVNHNEPEAFWRYQPLGNNLLPHYISLQGYCSVLDVRADAWLISLSPNANITWANFDTGSAQNYYTANLDLQIYIDGIKTFTFTAGYQAGQVNCPFIGAEFNLGAIVAEAAGVTTK